MTTQSVVKLLLTEGDKLIVSWFSPLQDQGGYAIAVNYGQQLFSLLLPIVLLTGINIYISLQLGSLLARIVFQPVEETSRIYFSKLLSNTSKSGTSRDGNLRQAATALISLLSIQCSMSVVFLVFGMGYMPIALHIFLPRQYLSTSAPNVLSAWVWYIPVLACNGVLEAFLSSVASPRELNNQSRQVRSSLKLIKH
jgi:oligosaccharide translocation protein RFT1